MTPEKQAPWIWLAEIANKVIRETRRMNWKPGDDSRMIYAGVHDFIQAFELPVRLMIAEAELALIMKHAAREQPSLGPEAVQKQSEINKLRFELAKSNHPDA
jgi:hypothetical protein